MSTESNPKVRLTVNDPVDKDTLARFAELERVYDNACRELMELKRHEVTLVATTSRVDAERTRLFEKVLIDRGLAPNTKIEIEGETGKLLIHTPQQAPQAQPAPQAAANGG